MVNFHGCSCCSIQELSEAWVTRYSVQSAFPKIFVNPQLETSKEIPALHSLLRPGTQKRLSNVLSNEKHFFSLPLTTPPLTSHLSSHIIYRTLSLSQLLSWILIQDFANYTNLLWTNYFGFRLLQESSSKTFVKVILIWGCKNVT